MILTLLALELQAADGKKPTACISVTNSIAYEGAQNLSAQVISESKSDVFTWHNYVYLQNLMAEYSGFEIMDSIADSVFFIEVNSKTPFMRNSTTSPHAVNASQFNSNYLWMAPSLEAQIDETERGKTVHIIQSSKMEQANLVVINFGSETSLEGSLDKVFRASIVRHELQHAADSIELKNIVNNLAIDRFLRNGTQYIVMDNPKRRLLFELYAYSAQYGFILENADGKTTQELLDKVVRGFKTYFKRLYPSSTDQELAELFDRHMKEFGVSQNLFDDAKTNQFNNDQWIAELLASELPTLQQVMDLTEGTLWRVNNVQTQTDTP